MTVMIYLAELRGQWLTFVNMIMNFAKRPLRNVTFLKYY
jgi:hypothetical protein